MTRFGRKRRISTGSSSLWLRSSKDAMPINRKGNPSVNEVLAEFFAKSGSTSLLLESGMKTGRHGLPRNWLNQFPESAEASQASHCSPKMLTSVVVPDRGIRGISWGACPGAFNRSVSP